MICTIKRILLWLRRCSYSRGFGIQSPWTYAFVRYVINEHYPYYAYADLKNCFPNVPVIERKLLELYFRIANFIQPAKVLVGHESEKLLSSYLHTACQNCDILSIGDAHFASLKYDLVILSLNKIYELGIEKLHSIVTDKTILIVEDIYRNKRLDPRWVTLSSDDCCGITFDLYYCGIICFDLSLYKQSYIINF
jgi:hypothetical protein